LKAQVSRKRGVKAPRWGFRGVSSRVRQRRAGGKNDTKKKVRTLRWEIEIGSVHTVLGAAVFRKENDLVGGKGTASDRNSKKKQMYEEIGRKVPEIARYGEKARKLQSQPGSNVEHRKKIEKVLEGVEGKPSGEI